MEDTISRRNLLGTFLLAHQLLRAQQDAQKDTTFSTDVNVVNIFATVRDKKGQIVRNLTKDDFTLAEDGRPQTIRYFSQESGLPLTLGLLVDTSMSQRRVLGKERDASYRFLDQVLREDKDHAFLIHFDREVELLQDLTSSRKKLEEALGRMETPELERQSGGGYGGGGHGGGGGGRRGGGHRGGGTSLYDSVMLASDELMKKQNGRKALIALTDGVDNGSKVTLSSAIESAQRADTLVYSILFADQDAYGAMGHGGFGGGHMGGRGGGYPGRGSRTDGKQILQRLSRETGGGFFEVSKKEPIEKIYDQIQEELRNQYSIGYTSDQPDASGKYHRIQLTTKKNELTVQTRDGYYAGSKT
jgi:VWFA-related protein